MTATERHRCYRGPRCTRREPQPTGPGLGAPINAEAGLCDGCTHQLGTVLHGLPRDYADLHHVLARVTRRSADLVTGTRDLPIPIRVDVEALMAEMVHEVLCWAESTAEIRGIVLDTQHARDARPGVVLQRCSRLLANSLSVLLALHDVDHLEHAGRADGPAVILCRDGVDGALALFDLHHRARAVAGLTTLTHQLPEPCPRCEYAALQRDDGSDTVECTACGTRCTWDDYQDRCTITVDREEIPA